MTRVGFVTLGCRLNYSETEGMRRLLEEAGAEVVEPAAAEVVVVNSCAVTKEAERKSLKAVRRWLREGRRVILTGCLPHASLERCLEVGAWAVVGNAQKYRITEVLQRGGIWMQEEDAWLPAAAPRERVRAFLKVQEGCSRHCSYCAIPGYRGRERSLPWEEVRRRLRALEEAGVPEVVLTGTHLASWGRDLGFREGVTALARAMAREKWRIRLRWSSLEPEEIGEEFLRIVLTEEVFCPHFHLPAQSGSDRVLRRMRRGYTRARYLDLVEKARAIREDTTITTDLIVGFPGEEAEDLDATLALIREARFLQVHAFPYSPRPGTRAAEWPAPPLQEVRRRMARVRHQAEATRREVLKQLAGRRATGIVEENQNGTAWLLTEFYVRARSPDPGEPGEKRSGILELRGTEVWLRREGNGSSA